MEPLLFFHTTWLKDVGINMTIVFNTLFIVLLLSVLSFLATRSLQVYPGRLQNVMETVVDALHSLLDDTMGHQGRKFFPLIATLGIFILTANLIGIIPGFDRYCFIFPDCQWHSKCHWIAYRTFRGSNQHYHHADHHYGKKKIT